MNHHIVEFRDGHFQYPDGTEPLKGLSFRITQREPVGIVGANGAGKSTLLLHVNQCLLPLKGSIVIGDHQMFFDDVAFGPLNRNLDYEKVRKQVDESLQIVGCKSLKNKPPHHLSSGQKSVVAIASIIAMQPYILVMDKPASSLDPRVHENTS